MTADAIDLDLAGAEAVLDTVDARLHLLRTRYRVGMRRPRFRDRNVANIRAALAFARGCTDSAERALCAAP